MSILLILLAGLTLFLSGVETLSVSLRAIAGERTAEFLSRFTIRLWRGVLSGAIVTTILDSSSAVIIMTVAFVSAGALTFRQSIGVVLGANIGTTASSQIIAFDIGELSALPLAAGFIICQVRRSGRIHEMGRVFFGAGLVFFGLFTMEWAVEPLKGSEGFEAWLLKLADPWNGVVAGAVITFIIQSSSAAVAMVIGLANQGLMNLSAGVSIMMGAELGTCSDTVIATIGRGRPALKTGLFHLGFNLVSIAVGLALFRPLVDFVSMISSDASLARTVANAHVLFNVAGVALFMPFAPWVADRLEAWSPGARSGLGDG